MTKHKFSKSNLKNCNLDLIKIANEAIKYVDFTIIEGHRSIEQQKENIKKVGVHKHTLEQYRLDVEVLINK